MKVLVRELGWVRVHLTKLYSYYIFTYNLYLEDSDEKNCPMCLKICIFP